MDQNTAGQETKDVQAPENEDLQYSDDVIENVMTEEQRNDYLEGREIEWTEEQKKVLGEEAQKTEGKKDTKAPVGPNDILGTLDRTMQVGQFVEQNAENTNAYQKLRRRAQTAEKKTKDLETRNKELEAENRAYKQTVEERKQARTEYNFDDPDDVERFIEDERKKAKEDAGKPAETKDPEPPAFQILDEGQPDASQPRFFDDYGNSYDEVIQDNPTGKPVFSGKTKDGRVVNVIDRDMLVEIDDRMKATYGQQLYNAMWGRLPNGQPGIMNIWRDKAPEQEIMAVFNSPDPVLATLQVYRSIIAALQQQQVQQPGGGQPPQQPPQPSGAPPIQPQPPQQPVRKETRPGPRGFGAGPITEQDLNPKPVDVIDVSDKSVRDLGDEGRDKWLMED